MSTLRCAAAVSHLTFSPSKYSHSTISKKFVYKMFFILDKVWFLVKNKISKKSILGSTFKKKVSFKCLSKLYLYLSLLVTVQNKAHKVFSVYLPNSLCGCVHVCVCKWMGLLVCVCGCACAICKAVDETPANESHIYYLELHPNYTQTVAKSTNKLITVCLNSCRMYLRDTIYACQRSLAPLC